MLSWRSAVEWLIVCCSGEVCKLLPTMMSTDIIDLSALSDDEDQRPVKRARIATSNPADEVEILEAEASVPLDVADLDDEEELAITGGTGVIWNRDLPHCRDTCGTHKFTQGVSMTNSSFCGKCYCYVCDCEASKCGSWGIRRDVQ
ncbi:hypothetical protein WJX72_001791 [[Myrmecia] bisecta]|uniref:Uncharacterized protein n=1 Tax=[Myrmecia] bisecta TaxID=41462 RepID=A0AAW1QPF3_9CHLO